MNFCLLCINLCTIRVSFLSPFCVIDLQHYTEILKKYRKGTITLHKTNFYKKRCKWYLNIHISNLIPKLVSSWLTDVALLAKTYTQTHTHTYCTYIGNTKKLRWLTNSHSKKLNIDLKLTYRFSGKNEGAHTEQQQQGWINHGGTKFLPSRL